MNFSIIIPIFNEELNIGSLVDEIFISLKKDNNIFELILVNDASTDDSLVEIKKLNNIHPEIIKFIDNKKNLGQSFSIIEGVKISLYKTIVTLDGDGQNNPNDIPLLLKKYYSNEKLSLVGGVRINRKDSLLKIISSKLANTVRRNILKDDCSDTGCSLKVFDKEVFLKFPFFNGIHRFLPALFKGYGEKTFFINVDHRQRINGNSKYGIFDRFFKGIKDLIKVAKIIKEFKINSAK